MSKDTKAIPPLATKQIRALELAASGLNQGQIAKRLRIAQSSLSAITSMTLERLQADSVAEAVAIGVSEGWIKLHGK
jgi:DNA-binding NarL/FixJ family response regulator